MFFVNVKPRDQRTLLNENDDRPASPAFPPLLNEYCDFTV